MCAVPLKLVGFCPEYCSPGCKEEWDSWVTEDIGIPTTYWRVNRGAALLYDSCSAVTAVCTLFPWEKWKRNNSHFALNERMAIYHCLASIYDRVESSAHTELPQSSEVLLYVHTQKVLENIFLHNPLTETGHSLYILPTCTPSYTRPPFVHIQTNTLPDTFTSVEACYY